MGSLYFHFPSVIALHAGIYSMVIWYAEENRHTYSTVYEI